MEKLKNISVPHVLPGRGVVLSQSGQPIGTGGAASTHEPTGGGTQPFRWPLLQPAPVGRLQAEMRVGQKTFRPWVGLRVYLSRLRCPRLVSDPPVYSIPGTEAPATSSLCKSGTFLATDCPIQKKTHLGVYGPVCMMYACSCNPK
jgi:hypothetical protein